MEVFDGVQMEEVIGNEDAVMQLRKFASDIDNGIKRKPIMISGPSGVGKSLAARLIAKEHGWHVVELNASDYRDKESIDKMLLAASQSRTIFGSKNLILLDEIDELAPRFDQGASSAINNVISNSKNPIIFIAIDSWNRNITFLRNAVDNIEFRKLSPESVVSVLEKVQKKTHAKVSKETIGTIAKMSKGDARSAINDMEVLDGAPAESIDIIGFRDRKMEIFAILDKIFLSNTFLAPLMASRDVADKDSKMLIRWIDENLPKKYADTKDLANAYEMLSLASMYENRASRAQYYTYWRYMNVFMSSGIALSKENYPDSSRRYGFPKMISELSKTKETRGVGKEIAEKLGKKIHVNTSRIRRQEMKMLAAMAKNAIKGTDEEQEQMYDFFYAKFGLEHKEVKWLVENLPN